MGWFKPIYDIYHSFMASDDGFSRRASTAFISICTAIYITIYKIPADKQLDALFSWQILAGVCLGLITIPELLKALADKKQA